MTNHPEKPKLEWRRADSWVEPRSFEARINRVRLSITKRDEDYGIGWNLSCSPFFACKLIEVADPVEAQVLAEGMVKQALLNTLGFFGEKVFTRIQVKEAILHSNNMEECFDLLDR